MANKVYWKSLRLVLVATKHYIEKWRVQLQANLTEAQYNCVVAVLEAVIDCLLSLPANNPE